MKILVTCALALLTFSLPAQDWDNLVVDGIVIDANDNPLNETRMVLELANGPTEEMSMRKLNKFFFKVDFEQLARATFYCDGFQPAAIIVDTRGVPMPESKYGFEFGGIKIKLEKMDSVQTPKVVFGIKYEPTIGQFVPQKR